MPTASAEASGTVRIGDRAEPAAAMIAGPTPNLRPAQPEAVAPTSEPTPVNAKVTPSQAGLNPSVFSTYTTIDRGQHALEQNQTWEVRVIGARGLSRYTQRSPSPSRGAGSAAVGALGNFLGARPDRGEHDAGDEIRDGVDQDRDRSAEQLDQRPGEHRTTGLRDRAGLLNRRMPR